MLTIATALTIGYISSMEADAISQRAENNQQARQNCNQAGQVVGACVGGLNANVQANVACSVAVLAGPLCP